MGWGSGSILMERLIEDISKCVMGGSHNYLRYDIYKCLIKRFVQEDCDTLDDCRGLDPQFDKALDDFQCLDQDN